MAFKLISATDAKPGVNIMIDKAPCTVRSMDISKTGKHGHAKVRIEAIGIMDNKKRVIMKPGHDKFEVPLIEKRKGQILSVNEKASVMDLESFETIEIPVAKDVEIKEGDQVEYWDIEGQKIIKRKI